MTRADYDAAVDRADAAMKHTNGHAYLRILKTRCMNCGRSPKQGGKCQGWVKTFVDCLYEELLVTPGGS